MQKKPAFVYGLGQCALDFIGKIEAFPSKDSKCEMSQLLIEGGGPIATALVALTRWGIDCAFCGVVGDDWYGNEIIASIKKEKVNTNDVIIRRGQGSQIAFIAAEKNSGMRTIFWRRPTGSPPKIDEINYPFISSASLFHTDGLFTEASLAACKHAKKNGIPVVIDAGTLREGMLDLAPYCDYYIASETFARKLTGTDNPLAACRKLLQLGPKLAAVTLGARGFIAQYDGKVIKRPAYKVNAVDTTGCGDIFHAGFIYGILHKWEMEASLEFAAWAAAQITLGLGGRSTIPMIENWKLRKVSKG